LFHGIAENHINHNGNRANKISTLATLKNNVDENGIVPSSEELSSNEVKYNIFMIDIPASSLEDSYSQFGRIIWKATKNNSVVISDGFTDILIVS